MRTCNLSLLLGVIPTFVLVACAKAPGGAPPASSQKEVPSATGDAETPTVQGQRQQAAEPVHLTPDQEFERIGEAFSAATPFEGRERIIGVGYIRDEQGVTSEELVLLSLRKSTSLSPHSNFHRKLYVRDEVCGTHVAAESEPERKLVQSAIQDLKEGRVPQKNAAYDWAQQYEFSDEHCRQWHAKKPERAASWEARSSGDSLLFIGTGWESDKKIAFEARRQVETEAAPQAPVATAPLAPSPVPSPELATPQDALTQAGIELSVGTAAPWQAPDAFRLPVASDDEVPTKWRLAKTMVVGHSHLSHAFLTPDGAHAIGLSEAEGAIRYYDAKTGRLQKRLPLPGYEPYSVHEFAVVAPLRPAPGSLTAPEVRVVTRGTSYVVDLGEGTARKISRLRYTQQTAVPGLLAEHKRSGKALHFQWHGAPDSTQSALSVVSSQSILKFSLTPDGTNLVVCRRGDTLNINLRTRAVRKLKLSCSGAGYGVSARGSLLGIGTSQLDIYSVGGSGRSLRATKLFTHTQYDNNLHRVLFTRDGTLVLTSSYDGKARSFARDGGHFSGPQLLRHGGTANVYALSLSADERSLLTSSGDQTLKLWVR